MATMTATGNEGATGITTTPPSRIKRAFKLTAWTVAFLFFLTVFTLVKLPQDRVRNFVNGTLTSALSSQGVSVTLGESRISVGFGLSYVMKDVTLHFVNTGTPIEPVKIDEITVSPSITALIFGKMGGDFRIEQADSLLKGSAVVKGDQVAVDFTADKLDLGRLGVLPLVASGIRGTGLVNGSGSISGDFSVPGTLLGNLNLTLQKVRIDAQPLPGGFKLSQPLNISEGRINVDFDKSKAAIRALTLGKSGTNDDIRGSASGDVNLGKSWNATSLNIKAQFSYSDTIRNDFFILDAVLKNGKQPDGSYSFSFNGPINNLQTTPPI